MAKAKSVTLSRVPTLAKVGIGVGLMGLLAVAYWTVFYADISGRISAAGAAETNLQRNLADARKVAAVVEQDQSGSEPA